MTKQNGGGGRGCNSKDEEEVGGKSQRLALGLRG